MRISTRTGGPGSGRSTDRFSGGLDAGVDLIRSSRARRFAITLLGLVAAAFTSGCSQADSSHPDVVLVVLDTFRADRLGGETGHAGGTPRLEAFASECVTFRRAQAASPWTLPSVGAILTGATPTALWEPETAGRLREALPTLAEVLQSRGYLTYAIVNSRFFDPRFGLDRGFDVYDFHPSRNDATRPASVVIQRALAWAGESRGRGPRLFVVHLFDPHLDYAPPPAFLRLVPPGPPGTTIGDRFEPGPEIRSEGWAPSAADRTRIEALYDAEVAATDEACGILLEGLRDLGVLDRALVIVTADHGEEFWDHGGFEHGHSLHREILDVPLLLRLPEGRFAGGRTDAPARHIDLVPTVLDFLGIEIPDTVQGRSLLPFAARAPSDDLPAVSEFLLYGSERKSILQGNRKLVTDGEGTPLELFDLARDSHESRDILEVQPEAAAALRAELLRWIGPPGRSRPDLRETPDPQVREILRALGYLEIEASASGPPPGGGR